MTDTTALYTRIAEDVNLEFGTQVPLSDSMLFSGKSDSDSKTSLLISQIIAHKVTIQSLPSNSEVDKMIRKLYPGFWSFFARWALKEIALFIIEKFSSSSVGMSET